MSKDGRTKLVPLVINPPEEEILEVVEECSIQERDEGLLNHELSNEIDCPRCNEIMELQSSFDKLMYWCENCSFQLKCA